MGVLRVFVLGRPRLVHTDARVDLNSTKAMALVCYLAVTRQPHSRSALAGLLWPDLPEDRARANLRLVLSGLRRSLPGHVVLTGGDVGPGPGWVVDLDERSEDLAGEDARAAREMARDDLLTGLEVHGAAGFTEWLLAERARVRRSTVDGLARMAEKTAVDDPHAALAIARELVTLDPLDEASHRLVIRLLAATGRRAAGLAQYETCRHVLAEEIGVDPSPETVALRDRILRDDTNDRRERDAATLSFTKPSLTAGQVPASPNRPALPTHPSIPLIGRQRELRQIQALLTDESCRLVTLVGPGGVGKTRLAMAAAEALAGTFADGVLFVSLAAVPHDSPATEVAGAVATSVDAPPWKDSPEAALRRSLAGRRLLLILDTVEHVRIADLLAELLDSLPDLTVLATSRQRIGLGAEWLIDIAGLPYPRTVSGDFERFPAVKLFTSRARHIRSSFTATEDPDAVLRICQLVEGLPLALELAADWMRSLPADQVARLIASDLDALTTEHNVVEARQRSMRSVLDASWRLLDPAQQRMLARLGVFSGDFDVEAALNVAGASATDLGRLADRCMVQRRYGDRFDLHELLRQFAAERLAADPHDAQTTRQRHATHYSAVAAARLGAADSARLGSELANLRSAATWLIRHGDEDSLASLVASLWQIEESRTRYAEAIALLGAALARPSVSAPRAGVWHRWTGTAAMELGQMRRAADEFEAALAAAGRPFPQTTAGQLAAICRASASLVVRHLGLWRRRRADPGAAERVLATQLLGRTMYFLQRPLPLVLTALLVAREAERTDDTAVSAVAFAELSHLGTVGHMRALAGHFGRRFDEQAVGLPGSELDLLALESRALAKIAVGDWDGATAAITRALDGAERLGHESARLEFIATAALVPLFQGRLADAKARFQDSLGHARRLGDEYSLLWSTAGVTETRLWLGADPASLTPLQTESVERSAGLPAPERMKGRAVLATLMVADGQPDEALTWVRAATAAAREARLLPAWSLDGYGHCAQSWLALWQLAGEPTPEIRRGAQYACRQLRRYARSYPIGAPRYYWAAGWLHRLRGRADKAQAAWRRSVLTAEQMRMAFDEARAHAALAQFADTLDARRRHHERVVAIADDAGFARGRLGLQPADARLTLS